MLDFEAAKRHKCPIPDSCTITNVVYCATVTNELNNSVETYTGLPANPMKLRIRKHESNIKSIKSMTLTPQKSGTRLSRHCGQLGAASISYNIISKILKESL